MDYGEKSALQSVGIWGGATAILGVAVPIAANVLGYEITADDVSFVIAQGVVVVGGVGAIWGRLRATKRIR